VCGAGRAMSVNEDISRFAGTYGDTNTGTDSFSHVLFLKNIEIFS
jgi:hypothetical protein